MSTMHVTCFLYLMIVIKHGRLFFKNSSFFKKLQCGILSGPETGRSFRATFWFVFTKPRPTPSGPVVGRSVRHGRANANSKTPSIPPSSKRPGKSLKSAVALIRKEGGRPPPKLPRDRERVHILLTSYPPPRPTRSPSGREHAVPGTR